LYVKADFLTTIGFFAFTFCYFFSYKTFSKSSVNKLMGLVGTINKKYNFEIKSKYIALIILYSLIYLVYVYYYGIVEYGALQRFALHFYTKGQVIDVHMSILTKKLIEYGDLLLIIFLIFTRMSWLVKNNKLYPFSFFLVLICYYATALPSGTRGLVLIPLLIICIIDISFYKRNLSKNISFFVPAFLLGISVIFIAILTFSRGVYFSDFNEFSESIFDIINTEKSSYGVNRFGGRIMDETAFVIENYGESRSFLGMHTLYSILVNPVPRVFWPSKPVGFGRVLALEQGFSEDGRNSLAAGIAGEGYANLGIVGAILFCLFFGGLSGIAAKIAHGCLLTGGLLHVPLGFLAFKMSTSFIRGDMLSAWGQSVYPIFLYLLIFLFIKKFTKN